jgi:ATP-dependent DNA helicase DinG
MTINMQREISRNVPARIPIPNFHQVTPLFTAYGCVLLERDTGKSYIYSAVNLKDGRRAVLDRRSFPLTTNDAAGMAEKMRLSGIAGAGQLEADKTVGENLNLADCRDRLNAIFTELLPRHGYTIRAEQISLADHILTAISRRNISLAEAGVGIGKTLAYLTAALLAKRGRLNGFYNLSFYTGTPYVEAGDMPVVVATSSIALQKALVTDYIPALSNIFMEHGIIKAPISFVIRKGREHYVCERSLRAHVGFEQNGAMRQTLEALLEPGAEIDLAEIDGLTPHVKRLICVSDHCQPNCPHRDGCSYLRFRKLAESPLIDIQVCNHNYLLADTLRRAEEQKPLIPNYQCLIIDEGHKFLQAARQMYGVEFSSRLLPEIREGVYRLPFRFEMTRNLARKSANTLASENSRLFRLLGERAQASDAEGEMERFTAAIDAEAARHLRNIYTIAELLMELLAGEPVVGTGAGLKSQLLWELAQVKHQAAILAPDGEHISWLELDDDGKRLCAIPKDLDKRLYSDLWHMGIPTIITSGTLSAGGDFSRVKQSLGLGYAGSRVVETSKPSPFDYYSNTMLYISEATPFPDPRDNAYLAAITSEIEKLVCASNGHAAVLFTSYKAMGLVCAALQQRNLPFPIFRMDKGGVRAIERFKRSGNGVLFASGSMWEGIDIPGDALSLLIIVKLPFAPPDPISEYERTLYSSFDEYKEKVITPEMLIRLLQGHGRLIRLETDSGVVAILDCRVNQLGAYRQVYLDALPDCPVTDSISCVEDFFLAHKLPAYHM